MKKKQQLSLQKPDTRKQSRKKTNLTKRLRNLYVIQANLSSQSGDFNQHTYKEKINLDIKKTAEQLMTVKRELLIPLPDIVKAIKAS